MCSRKAKFQRFFVTADRNKSAANRRKTYDIWTDHNPFKILSAKNKKEDYKTG
jgi:hypothetical protein